MEVGGRQSQREVVEGEERGERREVGERRGGVCM